MTRSPVNTSWGGRQGLGCSLALVLLSFGINNGYRIAYESSPTFVDWMKAHSYFAEAADRIVRGFLWVLIAYAFSRSRNVARFTRETGFDERPTISGWLLALVAIGMGTIDILLVLNGWARPNPSGSRSYSGGEASWVFFLVYTILLAPLFEEIVMRGFLYPAFRNTFGVIIGIVPVLFVQYYFHWQLISHDVIALLSLTAGGVALCLIREYSRSTWNCVLFHAAYNATVIRDWSVCIIGMAIALPLCLLTDRQRAPDA